MLDKYQIMEQSIPVMKEIAFEQNTNLREGKNSTLVHGDSHNRNFLYPKKENEIACIIDWQFWGVGIGTSDLPQLLGLGLKNEMRKYQKELVRHYYEILTKNEKTDYSWSNCWLDYRKGIIDNLASVKKELAGYKLDKSEQST